MTIDTDEIRKILEEKMSVKRMKHMQNVADEAKSLAKKWGANPDSAYLAGLVHDCAKELDAETTKEQLRGFGFEITPEFEKCPALLHGPLGAYLAKRDFGIDDPDILNAVYYHTTGRAEMSTLEKIIYIADFIEPSRSFRDVELVRGIAYEDLDAAVLCEAEMLIVFTLMKGKYLHPASLATRNGFLSSAGSYAAIRTGILQRID